MKQSRFSSSILRMLIVSVLILTSEFSSAEEPPGLAAREDSYFETAVAVIIQTPEIEERNGRKYRLLLQDMESEEIKPKFKTGNASGFFLYHGGDYYFVTAQHVALKLTPATRIGFRNRTGESRMFILAKLVGAEERYVWRHHEDTDLSVMKLHLSEKSDPEVAELAVLSTDLSTDVPPRTARLVVAGYPGGLGIRGRKISPITAVVHLASEEIHLGAELDGIQIENAYLVNPPAGKGFSGGPIFHISEEGAVTCVGMLNGAWSDPTGGKFSFSVPARYLLELVEKE